MFDKKLLESSELYDKRYRNFATLIIIPIALLVVFVVGFTVFATKQLTVMTVGDIEPVKIISQIQSTSSNPIIENNLQEGKVVKNNELLLKYNGQADTSQLNALVSQINQLTDQKAQLSLLQDSLTTGTDKFTAPDTYGYEATYQSYEAQVQATTDTVNKTNQGITDQNTATASQKAAITNQITTLNQQIAAYQAIEAVVSNGGWVSNDNPFINQLKSYKSQIGADPAQASALKSQMLSSLQSSIAQLQSSEQSLSVQAAGLTTSNAYDNSLESQLLALKAQALQSAAQTMTGLNQSLADLNLKITLQKQANKNDVLLAPSAGVLHVLNGVLGLKAIGAGTTIADIYPLLQTHTQVALTTYIPSSEIAGVKLGETARLSIQQNLPKPLILSGKITHIDSAPTTQNNQNFYKVQAETTVSKSDLSKVRYGLQGQVVIVTGEKTYFDYYKDKVMGND